jgi:transcriptional regulator with XRE-family HTH domain
MFSEGARRLGILRRDRRDRVKSMAAALDVSISMMSRLLSGDVSPSLRLACRIHRAFGARFESLSIWDTPASIDEKAHDVGNKVCA